MNAAAVAVPGGNTFHGCVFYADACDYTTRLAEDESQTIREIVAARRLIVAKIKQYAGHVVDQSGDSVLAWFGHAPLAVDCAISIQSVLAGHTMARVTRGFPQFRIGIASGEMQARFHGVFGKVITEAARLQALAAPGRIVISAEVHAACAGSAAVGLATPVRALLKTSEPVRYGFELPASGEAPTNAALPRKLGHAPLVMIVPPIGASGDRVAASHAAVFQQLLLECIFREQAEAMVVEQQPQAIHAIGVETGAPVYLVTANVHTARGRVIISVNILHGTGRRLIAADRIAVEEGSDGFAAIEAFAGQIFRSIVRNEIEASLLMKSVPKGVFQLYARARNALGSLSAAGMEEAIGSLEQCLQLEPDFARGWALLGKAYSLAWRFSWKTPSRDALSESIAMTGRAMESAPNDPVVAAQSGFALMWARERVRSQHDYDTALALGLSDPDEIADLAMVLQSRNEAPEAIALLERSLQWSPANADYRLWALGDIQFSRKQYGESLIAVRRMKNAGQASRLAAAASARLGLDPERYTREVLAQQPDFSVKRWIAIQPLATSEESEDFAAALLKAGLPL